MTTTKFILDAKIVAARLEARAATSASTIREKGSQPPGLREEPLTIFNADEKAELAREEGEERSEAERRGEERMKMVEETVHRVEEAASNVFHEAATVMHEVEEVVEEVAEEIYHGAERVLHDAGEKAKEYVPAAVGAYLRKSCTQISVTLAQIWIHIAGRDRGKTVTGQVMNLWKRLQPRERLSLSILARSGISSQPRNSMRADNVWC